MNSSVSIHDMQSFAESMAGPEIEISSDIGNVISLGAEDLDDDLGMELLANTHVQKTPARQQQNTVSVSAFSGNRNSEISFAPLEPISFDIPSEKNLGTPPEVRVNRESSSFFPESSSAPSFFDDNDQTASGPNIHISPAKRVDPEVEKKEKMDYIIKLQRLEKKGFPVSKRFTMDNELEEIKEEYDRLVDARNLENSLTFQRQALMLFVNGTEMLNTKFDPFGWQLDGWSESVHENLDNYDEIFEELYDKYKSKVNTSPEGRLLFALAGSGFMFHMSNNFFRSKMGNTGVEDILRNNPELAKQFAVAAAQQAGPGFGNFIGATMSATSPSAPPQPMMQQGTGSFYQSPNAPPPPMSGRGNMNPAPMQQQSFTAQPRKEMRGPSGVDDILRTFEEVRQSEMDMNPLMMPQRSSTPASMNPHPTIQAISELQSLHSEDGYSNADTLRTKGGGRKRRAQVPVGNVMSLNL